MRILRFDSVGGASGDMILGALLDLGVNLSDLKKQLSSLSVDKFGIQAEKITGHDFRGTRITVETGGDAHHRHFKDIRNIIDESTLSDNVKQLSVAVFERLAEAEAKVHNTTIDKIHFHEVGAMDSIVDIVGACIVLEMLKIDKVEVGPLPLGCGTVKCDHGIIPVPVPATVELLKGHPVTQTQEQHEMVTPTGAAILMSWKSQLSVVSRQSSVEIIKTGFGFGHTEFNTRTNMLRTTILDTTDDGQLTTDNDACIVLECNIDDTIPELIGQLCKKLMEQGALDVFTTPIQMKKQRPGILLTVLCRHSNKEPFINMIFSESTTFGIREYKAQRTILKRRHAQVETPYGKVRVKIGTWKGKDITQSPEHEDCVKCAEEHDVPVRSVYEAAIRG